MHSPMVRIGELRARARQLTDIGLVKLTRSASRQSSSISWTIAMSCGTVRSARERPPVPAVSAVVW